MLNNLKYFLKHSFIYSIGNVATKFSGVILLPVYSEFLTLTEFGILGIIEATLIIAVEILNFGQGQALVMLNNSEDFKKDKKKIFFSIFSSSLIVSSIVIILGIFFIPSIAEYFKYSTDFSIYLNLSLYVIALRILNLVFLNKLRADDKSGFYTGIGLLKLLLNLGFIVFFLVFSNKGIEGILQAYLISEGFTFLLLFVFMLKFMTLKFDRKYVALSFKFGIPLILGSVAMMLLNLSDRYIIKFLQDYANVGLYDLGYRIAGILNMFFIMPFGLTLMPIAYRIYKQDNAQRYFSKMMTYLTFILVWSGLAISVFSKEIVELFTLDASYIPAYKVVPIVVFSYIFFGMRYFSSLGMFLTRNTKYVAVSTVTASFFNIALNFIFIPRYGMIAAAWSTLFSFILLYFITYYFSNTFYKISFENRRLLFLISLGIILYILSVLTNDFHIIISILLKFILIIIFPLVLYIVNFYDKEEIEKIKKIVKQVRNFKDLKHLIKSNFLKNIPEP
jgi:O-antigen/teichoic acid export membrane protein